MGRLFWAIALAFIMLLTACEGVRTADPIPTKPLVAQALALQVQQTQAQLTQHLRLREAATDIQITQVKIQQRSSLPIDDLPGYRVQGTYTVKLALPSHTIVRRNNPYDLYLQRQREGKTWRLARWQTDEVGDSFWVTQLVPPPTLD